MNRTKSTFFNTFINIISMVILGILTFYRTAVIIECFGPEVNGIAQLSNQLISYLVLFESGICGAYVLKLYKPVAEKNTNKVASLFKGLKISLKNIAIKMSLVVVLIALFYPLVVNKENITYYKLAVILLIMGVRFVLPYFLYVSKKNFLMTIEKRNIMDIIDISEKVLIVILEIVLMKVCHLSIEVSLSIGIIIIIVSNYIYDLVLKKYYNAIYNKDIEPSFEGNSLTHDVMAHQVSNLVYTASDSVVLSMSSGLTYVTEYNAYYALISYVTTIIEKLGNNLKVIFGLKSAKKDQNIVSIFNKLSILFFAFAIVVTSTFYVMADQFITLQIGEQYTLTKISLVLFTFILFSKMFLPLFESIRNAYGLYKESKWFVILQTVVNLIISFALVFKFGVVGVLIGSVISIYFINVPFNLKLMNEKIFKIKEVNTIKYLVVSVIAILLSIGVSLFTLSKINLSLSWLTFILNAIICVICSGIITIISFLFIKVNLFHVVKNVMQKVIH